VPDPNVKWEGEIVLPAEEEMRSSVHSGCRFYPRCPQRMDRCLTAQPPLFKVDTFDHQASCYLYDNGEAAGAVNPHRDTEQFV
jgi:oligopeptide/dipeptide ABC transporter ATP-binding protein